MRKKQGLVFILLLFSFLLGGGMEGFTKEPVKVKIYNASTGQVEEVDKVVKTDAEWKKLLTPEQYSVTRLRGTEKPFSGQCAFPKKGDTGVYQCVGCGTDLFLVESKFESGTGWPSFWEPVSKLNIIEEADRGFGMQRVEIICARCGAHLGHVFDDGPPPTGKRYCVNSAAIKFAKIDKPKVEKLEKAVFAAGCFWGVQAAFEEVKGVVRATAGYAGGNFKNPTYEEVCSDKTGHAEAVEVEYDPNIVSYARLLEIFWDIHDPTTPNKQGPDIGSQYRSVIFYTTPEQEKEALAFKQKLEKTRKFKRPIVTEIVPAADFYRAEEYHQDYFRKHGLKPTCHISLK